MSNQKNEWDFQDDVTKKEFKVLYDALKRAKLPLSTEHNAVYGLEDVVLVLLYMCKNGATANRAVDRVGYHVPVISEYNVQLCHGPEYIRGDVVQILVLQTCCRDSTAS